MENNSGLSTALSLLPANIAKSINALPERELSAVCEIRLRMGRPVTLTGMEGFRVADKSYRVTRQDMDLVTSRAFRNSLHSSAEQLCAGLAVYEKGCRVGIAGTAAAEEGRIVNVKQISSLCIRIPREVRGCGEELFRRCLGGSPASLLICGAPSSGKTTYLRDIARLCGDRYRTALIDERGELAAVAMGKPENDVGLMTDVFDRYPRRAAVQTAVRVMSPQIIVCDEIGSAEDMADLTYAMRSGVKLIATCHCGSLDELNRKPNISELIKARVFDWLICLEGCKVSGIQHISERSCSG